MGPNNYDNLNYNAHQRQENLELETRQSRDGQIDRVCQAVAYFRL